MDATVISFVLNALLGVAMYFMKVAHDNTKESIKDLKGEIKEVRDSSLRREDFHDFRDQLWAKLDKLEAGFDRQLTELKGK